MPSGRTILTQVVVTVVTMFIVAQAQRSIPAVRDLLKG